MGLSALGGDGRDAVDGRLAALLPGKTGVPNCWVRLDESWAKRLGVQRTSGTYRIRSHEFVRRLAASGLRTGAEDACRASVEEIAVRRTVEAMVNVVPRRMAG